MSIPGDLIIVNTGPLLALEACNQIEVLRHLFARIVVPDEVDKELRAGRKRPLLPGGLTSAHRRWIEILSLSHPPQSPLVARLDPGEAAVIQLALELGASLVLIDDRSAWRVALAIGLTCIGSVGIILLAKNEGLIKEVKPYLYEMQTKGVYLSQKVIDDAIARAGETP
jgi:hypothetical protein